MTAFDAQERRIWAGSAEPYAAGLARLCVHPVPELLTALAPAPGHTLLDAGCGTGAVSAAAVQQGVRAVAVDAEPGMAQRAAKIEGAAACLAVLPQLPFVDAAFDAAAANFVVNHVGRPRAAVAELRRTVRPGGRVAATVWATPPAAGQRLVGRALEAAGIAGPAQLPALAPQEEFPRTMEGCSALLASAGLSDVHCRTLHWTHRTTHEEWWGAQRAGVGTTGHLLHAATPDQQRAAEDHFRRMSDELTEASGTLALPHAAVLAWGTA